MDTQQEKNAPVPAQATTPKNKMCKSHTFKIMTALVGVLLISLVSFAAGVGVGLHKARYSYNWGANYERNFIGDRGGMMSGRGGFGGMMRGFEGRDFRNAHGLAGTIISIMDNNIIVKDRDGKENTVAVTDKTLIRSQGNNLKLSDLKQNDQVVVMGNPGDNGAINADLIRVFQAINNNQ